MRLNLKKHIKKWKSNQGFTDANNKNYRLLFYALLIGIIVGLVGSAFRISLNYIAIFRSSLFQHSDNSGILYKIVVCYWDGKNQLCKLALMSVK